MINDRRWHVVYTRPRWEKKVANLLNEKNINSYCPVNKSLHQWSDRSRLVEEPLFKRFVFVQVNKQEMLPVKQTEGVLHFVEWLMFPAIVKDEEIFTIKNILALYRNVRAESMDVKPNDLVRIAKGPLVNLHGSIVSLGKHNVRICLESVKYALVVEGESPGGELIKHTGRTPQSPLRSSALLQ